MQPLAVQLPALLAPADSDCWAPSFSEAVATAGGPATASATAHAAATRRSAAADIARAANSAENSARWLPAPATDL